VLQHFTDFLNSVRLIILHFSFLGPVNNDVEVSTRMCSYQLWKDATAKEVVYEYHGRYVCLAHRGLAKGIEAVVFDVLTA
jgi:hypothetical protein